MKHLTLEQRYALKAYLECGVAKTEIAIKLGVDRSTIYRELKRNCTKRGRYTQILPKNWLKKEKSVLSLIASLILPCKGE